MRNTIDKDKSDKERQKFIDSVNPDRICSLASSHHNGDACHLFGEDPYKRGSFNVCYLVEFDTTPPQRWVVRIPFPGPTAVIDEKVAREVATMRYVAAKTTIPVPRIHAYSLAENSPIGAAYIIMEYIEGQSLPTFGFRKDKKAWGRAYCPPTDRGRQLNEQLANIYIQLRSLEFPCIGALGLPAGDCRSLLECDPDEFRVCQRPMSIELGMQELQGAGPAARIPPRTTFSTARSFAEAMCWLADNELAKSPDIGLDQRSGRMILYARHHFRKYVLDEWLDPSADQGPFVLDHGDMMLNVHNLLFDQDMNLVAVLDWEWSSIVPVQLLVPPVWILGGDFEWMMVVQEWHGNQVQFLVDAIRDREVALQLPPKLSQEWLSGINFCHTAVVVALMAPDFIHDAYWRFLFPKLVMPLGQQPYPDYHVNVIMPRVEEFIKSSPEYEALNQCKIQEQLQFFNEERKYFQKENPRYIATDQ